MPALPAGLGRVAVKSDRVELQEVAEQLDEKTGNEKKQT
jgi:hypothetical protein